MNAKSVFLLVLVFFLPLSGQVAAKGIDSEIGTEAGEDVWDNWLAIELHTGLGTPYGLLGLAADFTLLKWLSVSAGVGAGRAGERDGRDGH